MPSVGISGGALGWALAGPRGACGVACCRGAAEGVVLAVAAEAVANGRRSLAAMDSDVSAGAAMVSTLGPAGVAAATTAAGRAGVAGTPRTGRGACRCSGACGVDADAAGTAARDAASAGAKGGISDGPAGVKG